jgi:tetratricopeptide (TPR) repeat protein
MGSGADTREAIVRFIDEANHRLWNLISSPIDFNPQQLCEEILDKAAAVNYPLGRALGLLNIGRGLFIIQHDPVNSLKMIAESVEMLRQLDNKKWLANAYLIQAIISNTIGNRETALYSALRGIDFYLAHPEELVDRDMAFYIVGTVYKDLGRLEEAERFYQQGIRETGTRPSNWTGRIKTSLSGIYTVQGKYSEALELGLAALKLVRDDGNLIAESRTLTDIGVLYKKLGDYEKSREFLREGLAIREQHGIKHFTLTSLLEIGDLHTETGEINEAIDALKKAEAIALEIGLSSKLAAICQRLSAAYKMKEQYRDALGYSEKYLAVTLEITRGESEQRINQLHDSLLQEKEQEIERLKNVELKNAYQIISEKQKEILDSIHYAKRIQQSLLPSEKLISGLIERASGRK